MENVVLVIHLILALALIGVVLVQKSEGGGLGIGGGGGGGMVTGRSAANALTKLTWALAVAFFCTSIALTIIAAADSADRSVLDRLGVETPVEEDGVPALPPAEDLLPPTTGDAPAVPPRAD